MGCGTEMSNNTDKLYNALSNLKSKVWKRFVLYKKDGKLDKKLAV